MSSQPAHLTKHIPLLTYPFLSSTFALAQLTDGVSNGTALWLGGQCLSLYLAQVHGRFKAPNSDGRPRAIELGSGIGLTALALCSLAWDVVATDIDHVINTVLQKNITHNLPALPLHSGTLQVRELDWSVPPELWKWNHPRAIASHTFTPSPEPDAPDISPAFDLIISADTVYSADLVHPLLRAFHTLSTSSFAASSRFPTILLCIERRDPLLVDQLLADAKALWNFNVERVPQQKLTKMIQKGAVQWAKTDWEGIELWKLKLVLTGSSLDPETRLGQNQSLDN